MSTKNWFEQKVSALKDEGLYKTYQTIQSPIGPKVKIDGKWMLNFCSNDYLGLANSPKTAQAAISGIKKYGVGPAAVRTISGTLELHAKLEAMLCEFKKVEDVITFAGGFVTNLAVIPTITDQETVIFSDELNHASIIDGCRLSKADLVVYKHANPDDLKKKIAATKKGLRKVIITDGVFSMDGDLAPLPALVKISKKHDAMLVVDDAHGEGVLGKNGRGIVDHYNLHGQVDIEVGTLSKAFGTVGGFAAGKKEIIKYLRQAARPFLFSSAMTVPDTAAAIEAVKILSKSDTLVKKLWKNADYLKDKLSESGFDIGESQTPIIPIMLEKGDIANKFSASLIKENIFAKSIIYPTVAKDKARIRVMVSAAHSKENLDEAFTAFAKIGRKLKVIK